MEKKLRSKVSSHMINRIHVAMPTARDEKERTPFIPKSVLEKDANMTTPTKQERAAKQLQDALEEEEHNDEIWARGEVPGMNSKLWRGLHAFIIINIIYIILSYIVRLDQVLPTIFFALSCRPSWLKTHNILCIIYL